MRKSQYKRVTGKATSAKWWLIESPFLANTMREKRWYKHYLTRSERRKTKQEGADE